MHKEVRQIIYSRNVVIHDEIGLHLRPASQLVSTARTFNSRSWIKDHSSGMSANAKSILMLLSLALSGGRSIEVCAEGSDAQEAVDMLAQMLEETNGAVTF